MGCFNIMGFHSHLPLVAGDDAVLFLGVYTKSKNDCYLSFSPFKNHFTPIALPIFGKYDDYGRIESIERDDNVIAIEEFFEMDIDDVINTVDYHMCRRTNDSDNKMIDKIKSLVDTGFLDEDEEQYDIVFLLDHRFMYDTIKELGNKYYDFEKSIDNTVKLYPPWKHKIEVYNLDKDYSDDYSPSLVALKAHAEENGLSGGEFYFMKIANIVEDIKKKHANGEISDEEYVLWETRYAVYDNSDKWYDFLNQNLVFYDNGHITNLSVNQMSGYNSFWKMFYSYGLNIRLVLGVFKNEKHGERLFTTLRKQYVDFLKFIDEFRNQDWCFETHTYGGQEVNCKMAIPYYEAILDNCKKLAEKYSWEDDE